MSWDAVGAIAEVTGAIAVLATLVYLSIQVRQSRHLLERNESIALSQVHAQRAESRQQYQDKIILENDSLIEIFARMRTEGMNPADPAFLDLLTPQDYERYRRWHSMQLVHFDNIAYQFELGLLDADTYDAAMRLVTRSKVIWERFDLPVSKRLLNVFAQETP